ncbi:hypothetical protein GN958_ATG18477 [Phytophthora infestans]|uniref:Uncharacterized protein n=1 Tax=Phytophthora infestans TaxID=4787 RepID=A0A8S9TV99_PHYIN|nr:hypothetical protein GN958_ATG18477 [Phytophthora infestans]
MILRSREPSDISRFLFQSGYDDESDWEYDPRRMRACHIVEMRNRVNVVVTVVTKRTIEEGEEGEVDYVDP